MPRGFETDPALKRRVLDEALKGERSVNEIQEEHGVTMLRGWLEEHYKAHPEDPRRHLVLRHVKDGGRGGEEGGEEGESDGGDDNAREDMANKKRRGKKARTSWGGNRNGNPLGSHRKDVRAAVEAEIKKGKLTLTEIATNHGVHPTTLSVWKRLLEGRPVTPRDPVVYEKALAMLRRGRGPRDVAEELGLAHSAVSHWQRDLRAGRIPQEGTAAETQPPTQLVLREQTMVSNGPPSAPQSYQQGPQSYQQAPQSYQPRSSIVPAPRMGAAVDEAMVEANRTLLDERSALRGMVDILSREKAALERENDALRRQLTQQLGRA